jgi:DNA polymerase-3 subunit delta'
MFILVASRLERLLPTILSRVIQLRFDQIPLALTQEALNRLGLERPELLARLAGGSLGAAVNLAAADAVSYRDQALEFLEALPLAQPMRYVASQPWLESYDKQGGLLFTEMLLFLARDVLLWQNGLEEQIYNCDCTDRLRRLAASWPASHLKQAADIAQQAYQAIESNAGAKLVLETVVLKTDILRKEER